MRTFALALLAPLALAASPAAVRRVESDLAALRADLTSSRHTTADSALLATSACPAGPAAEHTECGACTGAGFHWCPAKMNHGGCQLPHCRADKSSPCMRFATAQCDHADIPKEKKISPAAGDSIVESLANTIKTTVGDMGGPGDWVESVNAKIQELVEEVKAMHPLNQAAGPIVDALEGRK
eukprot:TRINITY_DN631_c0_g1_i1.p3 TRINITY_DN631_c0_g1~~TRINITY_DN631_c0_g1_i1.p3  ORF type:complete len:182 (+),score=77.32 TRINITY_DN631_c0_g1_i1:105-650(+)